MTGRIPQGKKADLCVRPARILKSRKVRFFCNDKTLRDQNDSVVKTMLVQGKVPDFKPVASVQTIEW